MIEKCVIVQILQSINTYISCKSRIEVLIKTSVWHDVSIDDDAYDTFCRKPSNWTLENCQHASSFTVHEISMIPISSYDSIQNDIQRNQRIEQLLSI